MQKRLAIFIIIICTVLLQAHSIPFWIEQTGTIIGYTWSFTIEGVALWLWLNKKPFLATIASAIIILVPLMQLSKPLLNEIRQLSANTQISKLNILEINQSEKLQNKILKTNWAGTINKNIAELRSAIDTQKTLLNESSKLKSIQENIFIMILQAIALIVVLLTQIQATKMIAFREFQIIETLTFEDSEIVETPETRAKQLLDDIELHMNENGLKQGELSDLLDVSSSTISKLKNRINGSGEPLGDKKVNELEIKFKELENE